jgi:hypothetical protein
MHDFRQSKWWANYLKHRGWLVDKVKSADGKQYIQVLVVKIGWWPFTMLKVQRSEKDPNFKDLRRLERKYWSINTALEPLAVQDKSAFKKAGFHITKYPFLATKTVVVDVSKPEKVLWQELSENAKRLIKKNKDLKLVELDKKVFYEHWKKWTKVWIQTPKELDDLMESFGNRAKLWASEGEDGYHSGLLTLETKDTINYYQTWTSELGRQSGGHYKLVWDTMMWAKKIGKKYYDFEGIFDPAYPIKKWIGFTEFKKKFGGWVETHPGCYIHWF